MAWGSFQTIEEAEAEIERLAVENDRLQAACRKALEVIAPCVVGWGKGMMPTWAEHLASAVPDLQSVLGIERADSETIRGDA